MKGIDLIMPQYLVLNSNGATITITNVSTTILLKVENGIIINLIKNVIYHLLNFKEKLN